MTDLLRDTIFGHLVRLVSRGRRLRYLEEIDPSLWHKYVNAEKSAQVARLGHVVYGEEQRAFNAQPVASYQVEPQPTWADSALTITVDNSRQQSQADEIYRARELNELSGAAVDPEVGKNVNVVEWWTRDSENPMNWSTLKKCIVTAQICLMTFSVYIGSAIYNAGTAGVVEVFHVSNVAATLGLTLFVLGYGIGPMIWAPLSEIPNIGRNPIYIGTLLVFVLLQIPTALPTNFAMLLAFRFLTGFFGSPALAMGGASIADMFKPAKRTYALSIWDVAAVCGPVFGPLIGGFAAEAKGWNWTIWVLMWLSGFTLLVLFFFLPETSGRNILYRRTLRLRKVTGINNLICEIELAAENWTPKDIARDALVRPITLSLMEPIILAINVYTALVYGLLYLWFESFPLVFGGIYHFGLGEQGLAFIGILVGALVVIPPFFYYVYKVQERQFNDRGEIQPEKRLPPALVSVFCIPICLFWFGWSARSNIHWIMPIAGSGLFSVGTFLLYSSVLNYLPDAYPDYAASVLAGNNFWRACFGAAFPLFAPAMFHRLGLGWASSLLGLISCGFIPATFALYKYGQQLRMASKRALHDFT
ncbi:MAG: hypothetical protein M1835_004083 [Candelina submexicana]|nr:MAG: hypothetical protein M1835_004083 [Candelina submexicana]